MLLLTVYEIPYLLDFEYMYAVILSSVYDILISAFQIGKGSRGDVTILPTLVINNRQYRGFK